MNKIIFFKFKRKIFIYFLFLQAFSDEANELLPIFNKTSSRFYKATVPTGDWSNQVKYKKNHHSQKNGNNNDLKKSTEAQANVN